MIRISASLPSRPKPPSSVDLPEREIGPEVTGDRRVVDAVKAVGGAIGTGVGTVVGAALGGSRGIWHTISSKSGLEEIRGSGLAVAPIGTVAGAVVGLLVGGPIGAALGALEGTGIALAAGASVPLVIHGIQEGGPEAARRAAAGHETGVADGQESLRAAARTAIFLGDHSTLLEKTGIFLYHAFQPEPKGDQLDRFHKVDEGIYRGSQPGPDALKNLAAQGFKTIINLRVETDSEKAEVEQLGMKAIYLPEPAFDAPTMSDAMQFIDLVSDAKNQPVFFHCYSGVDRTGTMAACYRIAKQGWTADKAIQEARDNGMVEELQGAKEKFIQDFARAWSARHPQPSIIPGP